MWIFIVIIISIYLYLKYIFTYWEQKGIPCLKAAIPVGNLGPVAALKKCFGEQIWNLYKQTKEPMLGVYFFFRPALMINNPDWIKQMLTSDCDYFYDRGVYCDEKNDPYGCTLFSLSGQKWKTLRARLTSTFSSGKIKYMFNIISDESEKLVNFLDKEISWNNKIYLKDLTSCLTVNIVGSVFFGIEVNSFTDPDHKFHKVGKIFIDNTNLKNAIINVSLFLCPQLIKVFRLKLLHSGIEEYICDLFRTIVNMRKSKKIERNDFIQLLLEISDIDTENESSQKGILSFSECVAQLFLFYVAGSETSSSAISFCIFELSKNKTILREVRNEIDEMLKKNNGRIAYDSINELQLLEKCIYETLRMYPALPTLNRICTKEYKFPNSDFTVPVGTPIVISLLGIHRDPELFPNPDQFDPYRFDRPTFRENAFYPFGDGPRKCIAARLGIIVAKIGVVTLLSKYDFEPIHDKIIFNPNTTFLHDQNKVQMKTTKRKI